MSDLSGRAIKKLGKRLRDGTATSSDYDLLDEYRSEFDALLLDTAMTINETLNGKMRYIMAGRTKRTKSIIRKLARERNSGMDLSRMSDLVGLRIVVGTVDDQQRTLDLLKGALPLVHDPYDYRERTSGYRAIHLVSGTAGQRVETQIRTIGQHYWADESERLGEQAKEGIVSPEEASYLSGLFEFATAVDAGATLQPGSFADLPNWDAGLARLRGQFERTTTNPEHGAAGSFVVVYHQRTNSLFRVDAFGPSERAQALAHFRSMSRSMDATEYDIIVLNSRSKTALAVTHPRYFPESQAGA